MAKRGRKAKSRAQHRAEGTENATRHAGEDLDAGGTIGDPPDYLPQEALDFWHDAVTWMERMGIAQACDRLHLEAAAMMFWRLREAHRALVEDGLFTESKRSGKKSRHPAAIEAAQMAEKLRMWYNEVGFVPSARASMGGPGKGSSGKDDLEGRIFGKRGKAKPDLKAS